MEARLSRNGINPRDLNEVTYREYCKLYLIQKISEVLPAAGIIQYGDIVRIINTINYVLFENLYTETGKLLLTNKIYTLFMATFNTDLSREFLYKLTVDLAMNDPSQFKR